MCVCVMCNVSAMPFLPVMWILFLVVSGMSHEPKSPSLGMLSTTTRSTATVSPLTPSPINGALVPSGSPAANSTLQVQAVPSSSFAAALRKLAKQAEEPRGKREGSWWWVGFGDRGVCQPNRASNFSRDKRHPSPSPISVSQRILPTKFLTSHQLSCSSLQVLHVHK